MKISELPQLSSMPDAQNNGTSFPDISDTHVVVSTTPHHVTDATTLIPTVESGEFGTYSVPFLALFANIIMTMTLYHNSPSIVENGGIGVDSNNQTFKGLNSMFEQLVTDIAYDAANQCIADAINGGQLTSNNSAFVTAIQTIVNNMNNSTAG